MGAGKSLTFSLAPMTARPVISSELQLLLASCFQAEPAISGDLPDQNRLYKLVHYHGVRPVFLSFMHKNNVDLAFRSRLASECQHIAIDNLLSVKELIRISDCLRDHDIKSYAYKGSVWADWLYGNTGHREFGDIDLLIKPEVFSKAVTILGDLGYLPDPYRHYLLADPHRRSGFFRTDYHVPLENKSSAVYSILEAHWQIAYPRLSFDFPAHEWDQFSRSYFLHNLEVNAFDNEYQFLMLLVHHGGKEQWSKLKYIADLSAYMIRYGDQTNWGRVAELSRKKGIHKLFTMSLGLLKALGMGWRERWPVDVVLTDPRPYLKVWETMPDQAANSSWPYFVHGLSVHDGLKHKGKLIVEHVKYLTEWRLLIHKARWYYKNRS
jgi:hypothetical protein